MPRSPGPAKPGFPRRGGDEPWLSPDAAAVPLSDVEHVRAILVASAGLRRTMSYSELLEALGHRFSRPRMRAVCGTLDAIDEAARAAGEPELAVLVVRKADALPGQGWWVGGRPRRAGYEGPWSGPDAVAFVARLQAVAFDRWGGRADP
ncbi:hypothetical protein [Lichenibacterium minor]|uniref:hypothetical protein n=1 Tax=Lichenibacterium minor TaxID=2316528 RepID=UPI001A91AC32|nr:hypothetical protein [Lichenibacterium minor]